MNTENKTINRGEALADFVSVRDYGTVIRYQDIEAVTHERRGTARYYQAIAKAKKLLEDRGKMIKLIGGGDYQILYPGDYSGAYSREVRLANKRIKHGDKILKNAPTKDMTQEELQIYNRVSDFHASLQARMSGNVVEVKKLASRNHPLAQAVK